MTNMNMTEKGQFGFAYVPHQTFKNLYPYEKALYRGTIFEDLDIPFECYRDNPIMNPFK